MVLGRAGPTGGRWWEETGGGTRTESPGSVHVALVGVGQAGPPGPTAASGAAGRRRGGRGPRRRCARAASADRSWSSAQPSERAGDAASRPHPATRGTATQLPRPAPAASLSGMPPAPRATTPGRRPGPHLPRPGAGPDGRRGGRHYGRSRRPTCRGWWSSAGTRRPCAGRRCPPRRAATGWRRRGSSWSAWARAGRTEELSWAVEDADRQGVFDGTVDLGLHGDGIAEVGFGLHPDARRRHLMAGALRLVRDFAFDVAGLAGMRWRAGVGDGAPDGWRPRPAGAARASRGPRWCSGGRCSTAESARCWPRTPASRSAGPTRRCSADPAAARSLHPRRTPTGSSKPAGTRGPSSGWPRCRGTTPASRRSATSRAPGRARRGRGAGLVRRRGRGRPVPGLDQPGRARRVRPAGRDRLLGPARRPRPGRPRRGRRPGDGCGRGERPRGRAR